MLAFHASYNIENANRIICNALKERGMRQSLSKDPSCIFQWAINTKINFNKCLENKLIISSLIRHTALSEKSRFFNYFIGKETNYIIDTMSFTKKEDMSNTFEKLDEFLKRNKYCILKESTTNNALGIHIVSNVDEVLQILESNPEITDFVIQKYIDNPLLLNGLKFHIRVNVLVFGCILIYVHDNICCHVSTEKFKLDDFDNSFIHITNYRINKTNPKFDKNIHLLGYEELCKMLGNEKNGYEYWYNSLFKRICDIIKEVMVEIMKDKKHFFTIPNSFEIFGFDIILDDNENIYVLEVNNGPCLESECDENICKCVVEDTLRIVLDPILKKETTDNHFHLIYSSEPSITYSDDFLNYVDEVSKEEL